MLVLSRKVGDKIVIGEDVTVTVVSVHTGKVRLGIEAPRGVTILRSELVVRGKSYPPSGDAAPNQG